MYLFLLLTCSYVCSNSDQFLSSNLTSVTSVGSVDGKNDSRVVCGIESTNKTVQCWKPETYLIFFSIKSLFVFIIFSCLFSENLLFFFFCAKIIKSPRSTPLEFSPFLPPQDTAFFTIQGSSSGLICGITVDMTQVLCWGILHGYYIFFFPLVKFVQVDSVLP